MLLNTQMNLPLPSVVEGIVDCKLAYATQVNPFCQPSSILSLKFTKCHMELHNNTWTTESFPINFDCQDSDNVMSKGVSKGSNIVYSTYRYESQNILN